MGDAYRQPAERDVVATPRVSFWCRIGWHGWLLWRGNYGTGYWAMRCARCHVARAYVYDAPTNRRLHDEHPMAISLLTPGEKT